MARDQSQYHWNENETLHRLIIIACLCAGRKFTAEQTIGLVVDELFDVVIGFEVQDE